MERPLVDTRDRDRILRHIRWRPADYLLGHGLAAIPRIAWTSALVVLALHALGGQAPVRGAGLVVFLWTVAVAGLSGWIWGRTHGYLAVSWAGYYIAWIALSGIMLSVPHLLNVGRVFMVVGAILAIVEVPSRGGFLALVTWGIIVGMSMEYFCLQSLPGFPITAIGVLIYFLIPMVLMLHLGVLERLYVGSFSDDLTGMGNRKLLRWLRRSLWLRMQKQGRPLSLLLLDVDDFKKVNDNLGHTKGDEVLWRLARLIEDEVRQDDIVCRYGGDEFMVFLLDSGTSQAVTVANRLCQRVVDVFLEELPACPLTVSMGIASYPEHADNLDKLVEQADQALICGAKAHGKNQVSTASSIYRPDPWQAVRAQLPHQALPLAEVVTMITGETVDHMVRLADVSYRLGKTLGLSEEVCARLTQAAALHDVGKIIVPKMILEKHGPLTWEEQQSVMLHSQLGATMLANLNLDPAVVDAVRYHHEWWDGTGYPDGLREGQSPILAAILSVADAYDAMTNYRPYQETRTPEEALLELMTLAEVQFDPRIVDAMQALADLEEATV